MTIKKRVYSCVALVVFLVFVCPLYLLPVSAATDEMTFKMDVAKPDISDNNGYIEVLFYDTVNNNYFVRTYIWFTHPLGNNVDQTFCQISLTDDYVRLAPGYHIYDSTDISNQTIGARLNYFWTSTSGYTASSSVVTYYGQDLKYLEIKSDNCTIEGIHCYGNFRLMNSYNSRSSFSVIYSDVATNFNKLVDIIDLLTQLETLSLDNWFELTKILDTNESIDSKLSSVVYYLGLIDTGIDELNYKLDRIIENTDDIEEKLDKIIDILESNIDTDLPTEVPKDSLNEHNSAEDDLINGLTPSDDLDDVHVDTDFLSGDSFTLAWSLIERALSTSDYLLIIVTIVLVLGIIALILNR